MILAFGSDGKQIAQHTCISVIAKWKLVLFLLITNFPALSAPSSGKNCNPVALNHCLLPFPSDHWLIDHSSQHRSNGNNKILSLENDLFSTHYLDSIHPIIWPEELGLGLNNQGIDGFSPVTAIYFDLEHPPNQASLPKDGGDAAVLFDLTANKLVPIRADISTESQRDIYEKNLPIIELRPRSRLDHGHRYFAFLTKKLVQRDGRPQGMSENFQQAISGDGSELSALYEEDLQLIENNGFQRSELITGTIFTVRSEANIAAPMLNLASQVFAAPQRFDRNSWKVQLAKEHGTVAAIVSGSVSLSDFRQSELGDSIRFSDASQSESNQVEVVIGIPRAALEQAVPIAIYGHSLGLIKESFVTVLINNSDLGIATVSIDFPYHGNRVQRLTDNESLDSVKNPFRYQDIFSLASEPTGLAALTTLPLQSTLDLMALLKAVSTDLHELDLEPLIQLYDEALLPHFGKAKFDTERIFYQGTSLGSVFGTGFLGIAPIIKGGFLQVGGGGISDILSHSVVWDIFGNAFPNTGDPVEKLVSLNLFQLMADYGDGISLSNWYAQPPTSDVYNIPFEIPRKPILLQYSIADQVVPNRASLAFAEAISSPILVTPRLPLLVPEDVAHLSNISSISPNQTTATYQVKPLINPALFSELGLSAVGGVIPHISFGQANSINVMGDWIEMINVDLDPAPVEPEESSDERGLSDGASSPEISAGSSLYLLLGIFAWLLITLPTHTFRTNITGNSASPSASTLFRKSQAQAV